MSSRREARERVLKGLYAFELGGGDARHVIKQLVTAGEAGTDDFSRELFETTVELASEADDIIGRHAENWEVSRIALIDRLLLRMAIAELLGFVDIPPKVSINEAIELAKSYSTAKSGQFVNGILDSILITLKEEGRLHKTGRGLIGMEELEDRSVG